jgi:hypothetical protein
LCTLRSVWRRVRLVPVLAPPMLLVTLVVAGYWRFVGEYFQGGDTWPHIWTTRSDPLHVLAEPIMAGTVFPRSVALFFRPLSSLSYAATYRLWGMDPLPFHLTDLLIHLAATLALYTLATTLGLRRWAAAVGTAIFALHPIMASVVPDLPRRHDSLAAAGVFAALTLAARAVQQPRGAWVNVGMAAALLGLAELAKEVAYLGVLLALPILLTAGLAATCDTPGRTRRGAWVMLAFVLISGMMLVWRWQVIGGLGGYFDQTPPLGNLDVALNDLLQNLLFPFYPWLGKTLRAWLTEIGLAVLLTALPALLADGRIRRVIACGWVWLLIGGLFQMLTKSLTAWQTYLTLASCALLIGGVLDGATRTAPRRVRQAALALSSVGALWFAAGVVMTSVLVRPFDEWHIAGEVARMYLSSLRPCLEAAPPGLPIVLSNVPDSLDDATPERMLIHPGILGPYSVAPAIELVMSDLPPRQVTVRDVRQIGSLPRGIASGCAAEDGAWQIRSEIVGSNE